MLKQNNSDTKATIQDMKENHPNKVIKERTIHMLKYEKYKAHFSLI